MTKNDIFRRLRYLLNLDEAGCASIFELVEETIDASDIESWLKKDDDPELVNMPDRKLAAFLNGLIIHRRGRLDGPLPVAEKHLSNNLILKKLKIAFNLKSEDVQTVIKSGGGKVSPHELSAFFRKSGHGNYRVCKDQVLRQFLRGLQKQFRP